MCKIDITLFDSPRKTIYSLETPYSTKYLYFMTKKLFNNLFQQHKFYFHYSITTRFQHLSIIPITQNSVAIIPIKGYTITKNINGGDNPWNINPFHK